MIEVVLFVVYDKLIVCLGINEYFSEMSLFCQTSFRKIIKNMAIPSRFFEIGQFPAQPDSVLFFRLWKTDFFAEKKYHPPTQVTYSMSRESTFLKTVPISHLFFYRSDI